MYVLCFNINISLTPTESIMKLMSVCVCARVHVSGFIALVRPYY